MLLDPRTKKKLSKILSETDKMRLWRDLEQAALDIPQSLMPPNDNEEQEGADLGNARASAKKKTGAARFIPDSSSEDESECEDTEATLLATVSTEFRLYKADTGCPMASPDGTYNCPLEWWRIYHAQYPNIWNLAQRILSIPATSAPAERVFSAASNIVNKKRVNLKPESVDLLIFLRGNKQFVDWET
jgi:hypothetical protein